MTPEEFDAIAELADVLRELAPPDGQRRISKAMDRLNSAEQMPLKPMGCICPGNAPLHCENPLCPRKSPNRMPIGWR